jgi:hypothetical protein
LYAFSVILVSTLKFFGFPWNFQKTFFGKKKMPGGDKEPSAKQVQTWKVFTNKKIV